MTPFAQERTLLRWKEVGGKGAKGKRGKTVGRCPTAPQGGLAPLTPFAQEHTLLQGKEGEDTTCQAIVPQDACSLDSTSYLYLQTHVYAFAQMGSRG